MNNEYMIFKEHAIVQFRSITIKLLWSLNTLRKVMNFYVLILDLFYIYEYISCIYIYMYHVLAWCSDPLGLELEMILSVDVKNRT